MSDETHLCMHAGGYEHICHCAGTADHAPLDWTPRSDVEIGRQS